MTYEKLLEIVDDKLSDYKLIYLTIGGSKLYGTNTDKSDTDIFGIYIPSFKDLLFNNYKPVIEIVTNKETKNDSSDIDIKLFSIQKFLNGLAKGEKNSIDILYSMFSNKNIKTDFSNIIRKKVDKLFKGNINGILGILYSEVARNELNKEYKKIFDIFIDINNNSTNETLMFNLKDFNSDYVEIETGSNYTYVKFQEYNKLDFEFKNNDKEDFIYNLLDKYELVRKLKIKEISNESLYYGYAMFILLNYLRKYNRLIFPLEPNDIKFLLKIKNSEISEYDKTELEKKLLKEWVYAKRFNSNCISEREESYKLLKELYLEKINEDEFPDIKYIDKENVIEFIKEFTDEN